MIDFEKVIRDAALKQGIVLRKDDPSMMYVPILNNMLDDLNASMTAALDGYKSAHEGIARRWRGDAEASAAKILNAALDAGREAAAATMNEGAHKVVAVIHEELVAAMRHQKAELGAATGEIKRYSFFMLLVSGAILGGAVLIMLL
jgi:hypothetical protein